MEINGPNDLKRAAVHKNNLDTSQKLSEALIDYLREEGLTKKMLEHKAEALWQTVMGPTVNRATSSVHVQDGILFVSLNSSVVRHQLFNLKSRIISAINNALGQDIIKDIRFS